MEFVAWFELFACVLGIIVTFLSEEEKQSDEFPSYYSRDAGVEDG